jgi:hypothetical protein
MDSPAIYLTQTAPSKDCVSSSLKYQAPGRLSCWNREAGSRAIERAADSFARFCT